MLEIDNGNANFDDHYGLSRILLLYFDLSTQAAHT